MTARLEQLYEDLPEGVATILRRRHAHFEVFDEDPVEVLTAHGYAAHEAALAFEARYGGLVFATEPRTFEGAPVEDGYSTDNASIWMFGPVACLVAGGHSAPRGGERFRELYGDALGLVPVAYGPDDDIWFVDAVGRGYYHDTCYDLGGPHLCAQDLGQVFPRVVLSHWLRSQRYTRGRDGWRGEEVAAAMDLPLIGAASDPYERWWGADGTVLVERVSLPMFGGELVGRETRAATHDRGVWARLTRHLGQSAGREVE
jgi:hypothetical protein